MSFLSKIFKKKPGGTFFGNLLRGAASVVPVVGGTVIGTGANKIELGETKTNKELASMSGEERQQYELKKFAGQPATVSNDGTINMQTPLEPVTVTAVKENTGLNALAEKIGEFGKIVVSKSTEEAKVGADNKTLLVIAGVGMMLFFGMMSMSKK